MSDQKCLTVTWAIENFSIYWLHSDILEQKSPSWQMATTHVDGEHFHLGLSVTVFKIIFRLNNTSLVTNTNCEMFLVSSCGTIPLKRKGKSKFSINRSDIFGDKKHLVLPKDTLTVCCKILEVCINKRELRFCSVLHRMSFPWAIENFNIRDLIPYQTSWKQDNILLHINIVRNENRTYTITARIEPLKYVFEFYLLDFKFSQEESSLFGLRNLYHHPNYTTWKANFFISALRNSGNLPLHLEFIVAVNKDNTTTTSSSNSIKTSTVYPENANTQTVSPSSESVKNNSFTVAVQDSPGTLSSDFLSLLRDTTLSDAILNTEGKSFSAHKVILAARSSVFKAMFEKEDTTEGRSGVVDIEDIDSETVQRLLVFLYGESLEDLQWDDAAKLYYAADKYAVLLLKQKCSNILKAGLSVSNACDTIALADRHSDDELMNGAVDYVRDHQEVMSSSDWERLEESDSRLANKILRQVFIKKGKN